MIYVFGMSVGKHFSLLFCCIRVRIYTYIHNHIQIRIGVIDAAQNNNIGATVIILSWYYRVSTKLVLS